MTHPSAGELALYAGGDLPWFRRRRIDRHVWQCGACQSAAAEYSELRAATSAFPSALPYTTWSRLESEMKANIRLGLAAGECVQPKSSRGFVPALVSGKRLLIAGAMLAALAGVGIVYERPNMPGFSLKNVTGAVLEASGRGIQVREGRQTLRLVNRGSHSVSYTVGAMGELRASSVDPDTGNVTITHVYGE